jgi:hypothetical protein
VSAVSGTACNDTGAAPAAGPDVGEVSLWLSLVGVADSYDVLVLFTDY